MEGLDGTQTTLAEARGREWPRQVRANELVVISR